MMKVLHVLNELKPSGAETMLCIAGSTFASNGITAEVLSTGQEIGNYAPNLESTGYTLKHIPFVQTPLFFLRLYRLMQQGKYDVIHLHTERANFWIGLVALSARPKRVLRTIHSNFCFGGHLRIRRMLQRRFLEFLGVTHVAISTSVQQNELKTFGLKTRYVPNWYEDTRFTPATVAERRQARADFGIPPDRTVIITVGNCSEIKNHESLLHALAMLPLENRPIYLHVGNENVAKSERKLAVELGLENSVRFLGPLTDIRPALVSADIFVMPSLYEGFGIAAIEGLAMGLPAIFTDAPGLRDFRAEYDGLVYADPDASSLHDALLVLLLETKETRLQRSENYQDISKQLYSVRNGVSGYLKIYSDD